SSRRRHTRSKRDWSSDVCSSDLRPRLTVMIEVAVVGPGGHAGEIEFDGQVELGLARHILQKVADLEEIAPAAQANLLGNAHRHQIGRASCRERVYVAGFAASLHK